MELSGQDLHTHRINVVFTSSRDAPLRVRRFLNELVYVFPNSLRINRGRQSIQDILYKSLKVNAKFLVIVDIMKGNPSRFRVYDLSTFSLKYYFLISGVTLLYELNLPRVKINRGCIGNIENQEIKNFVFDLGYSSISECDAYASGELKDEDTLELKFSKGDKILGPIIRFLIRDKNSNENRGE